MNALPGSVRCTITFRTPFAVTSGSAGDGLDSRVDPDELLPASSLKGLMRAEATTTLRVGGDLIKEVFGAVGRPSSWAWSDGVIQGTFHHRRRARLKIVGEGRADEGSLLMAEQIWATTAVFSMLNLTPLDEDQHRHHLLILRASARSVTSLGASRRRGQGWVDLTDDQPWTQDDSAALLLLRENTTHD